MAGISFSRDIVMSRSSQAACHTSFCICSAVFGRTRLSFSVNLMHWQASLDYQKVKTGDCLLILPFTVKNVTAFRKSHVQGMESGTTRHIRIDSLQKTSSLGPSWWISASCYMHYKGFHLVQHIQQASWKATNEHLFQTHMEVTNHRAVLPGTLKN